MMTLKRMLGLLMATIMVFGLIAAGVAEENMDIAPEVVEATEAPIQIIATAVPATEAPIEEAPATEAPATEAPATEAPATEAPATEVPATEAPATEAPATEVPATETPATEVPATETPATEQPTEEPTITEEPTQEPTEEPTLEPTEEPFTGSVLAVLHGKPGGFQYGETVTLEAFLSGFENVEYTICWEFSENGIDEWTPAEGTNNGTIYEFSLNEQNANWYWRVVVDVW